MKKLSIVIVIAIFLSLCSCGKTSYKYKEQYKDLYTVAIHSVLWINGCSFETDLKCDPNIEVWEQDSYGRVLFSYTEKFYADFSCSYLIISQKTENDFVYYYPDYNFILTEKSDRFSDECADFSDDEIERLKVLNDWEQEFNSDKCEKKAICDTRLEIPLTEDQLNNAIDSHNDQHGTQRFCYLTEDRYGRFVCFGYVLDDYFAILFNPDGTYCSDTCFFTPDDFYNYQDEFREFKEQNNWNQPLE